MMKKMFSRGRRKGTKTDARRKTIQSKNVTSRNLHVTTGGR